MRPHRISRILSIVLVACISFSGIAAGKDKSFSISKKLTLHNFHVSLALDSDSGNVLVVWTRYAGDLSVKPHIMAALCKPNKVGKYKASIARQVSAPDTWCDVGSGNDVAYNPDDGGFLAVWTSDGVFTRRLNAAGIPLGQARLYKYLPCEYPVVAYHPAAASPASIGGGYILAYSNYAEAVKSLETVLLDGQGNEIAKPAKVLMGQIWPSAAKKIIRDTDGAYIIALLKSDGTLTDSPTVVRVSADGRFIRTGSLTSAESNNLDIIQLSGGLYLASYNSNPEGVLYRNQLFKKTLKRKGAPFEPDNVSYSEELSAVSLQDSECSAQLSIRYGSEIWIQLISSTGKYVGEPRLVLKEGRMIAYLRAVALPGGNKVFAAYSVSTDYYGEELRGLVFDALKYWKCIGKETGAAGPPRWVSAGRIPPIITHSLRCGCRTNLEVRKCFQNRDVSLSFQRLSLSFFSMASPVLRIIDFRSARPSISRTIIPG
jgi:hypothetical protein